MANFKQFEYAYGPKGLIQIQSITGAMYQVVFLQLRDNFQTINPQPAKMSQNYPLDVSSNPVVVRPQPLQKSQSLTQWLPISNIDANYISKGFSFHEIRKEFLDNKGYLNDQEPPK